MSLALQMALAGVLTAHPVWGLAQPAGGRAPSGEAEDKPDASLPEVQVQSQRDGAATEGSGQYSTEAMGTATGLSLSPRETPQSTSVVTRQQIEDKGLRDTGSILASAPGISVTRSDSNRWAFTSRGFSIDNLQFDGLSVPTLSLWNYGSTDLDAFIYDRVEIVRGATGLMSGSGNPSAAVNFIRKKPLREFAASAEVSVGRWNERRLAADISTPFNRDGSVRGRLVTSYSQGDSHVELQDSRKRMLYGVISADLTSSTLLTAGLEYQRNEGNGFGSGFPLFFHDGSRTNFDRSVANNTRWSGVDTETTTAFVDLNHRFGSGWNLRAAYSHNWGDYRMKQLFRGGYPNRETGLGMNASFASYDGERSRDDMHFSMSGPFDLLGRRHELSFGWMSIDDHSDIQQYAVVGPKPDIGSFFQWRNNRIAEPQWANTLSPADDMHVKQSGAYAVGRFSLADPLHLIVGGRISDWETRQNYYGTYRAYKISSQFTPYAGLVYDINPTYSAYASYTEIFQPQNNRAPDGSILAPIDGKSYEAGVKASYLEGRLQAAASVYQTRQNNLAQAIPGETVQGMPGVQAYRAAAGAKVKGFELEANGALSSQWNVAGSYTHFTAKDAKGQPINTSNPRSLFKLYSTYRLDGSLRGLTLGGGVDWQSSTWQSTASPKGNVPVGQGSYAVVNLMARYDFSKQLSATLNINNALDRHYYSQLGFYSQGWWGTPRNVSLLLRAQY